MDDTLVALESETTLGGPPSQCPPICKLLVMCLVFASISFSMWALGVGWNNSIFDAHGFRQAQTAISVYYTKWGSEFLSYETPVLGPPWSIPFEFPMFQSIVALVWRLLPLQLDQAGRLTAVAFFYATFPPLFILLRAVRIDVTTILVTVALFAVSPQYIFWSRTFMIESTALCLAVTYLMFVVLALNHIAYRGSTFWVLGTFSAIAGVLAGMVKITTFVPFFLCASLLLSYSFWKRWGELRHRLSIVSFLPLCALLMPVFCVAKWTAYADSLKNGNPLGGILTSHMLRGWNFGTFQQRIAFGNYVHFAGIGIGSVLDDLAGSRYLLLLSCVIALAMGGYTLRFVAVCVTLYMSAIAIFFNLYFVHTYYSYANGIFIIAVVGIASGSLLNAGGWRSWAGVCVFVLAIGFSTVHYLHAYYRVQRANAPGRPLLADILDRETKPTDVLLIYGLDWSAELPYQAHRRAIMIREAQRNANLQQAIREEGVNNISNLLICNENLKASADVLTVLREYGVKFGRVFASDGCDIYLR